MTTTPGTTRLVSVSRVITDLSAPLEQHGEPRRGARGVTAVGDTFAPLRALGWDDDWARALAEVGPTARPARVLRHHGAGLVVALDDGPRTVMFTLRMDPEPTVGDWVALVDDEVVTILPRRSLLRRRASHGGGEQQLAANIDRLLLACGLDRPVKDGRIQRGTAIAHDAGAEPVVVLTKSAGPDSIDPEDAAAEVRAGNPGVAVVVTSVREGVGVEVLHDLIAGKSVALLGESGAGKSSIVNALLGTEVALTGEVREGDSKGRHTTTTRELHLLVDGGVLIDSPGIREVGLGQRGRGGGGDVPGGHRGRRGVPLPGLRRRGRARVCHHRRHRVEGSSTPSVLARWKALLTRDAARDSQIDRPGPRRPEKAGMRFAKEYKEAQRRKGRR